MKVLARELWISVVVTMLTAAVVCGVYPAAVWVLGREFFPRQAAGSLLACGAQPGCSSLLGREFPGPRYFHSRPSAAGAGYDVFSSGGTNAGPLSERLIDAVGERVSAYRRENGLAAGVLVPADAVTASASGLDPHISVENARMQAARVAAARGIPLDAVFRKIEEHTAEPAFRVLGRPRVNVVMLNLDLDGAL